MSLSPNWCPTSASTLHVALFIRLLSEHWAGRSGNQRRLLDCAGRNLQAGEILWAGYNHFPETLLSTGIVSEEFVGTRPELATLADSQGKNALFNGFPVGSIHNDKPMTVHVVLVVESAGKDRQLNLVRGNDLRHEFFVRLRKSPFIGVEKIQGLFDEQRGSFHFDRFKNLHRPRNRV